MKTYPLYNDDGSLLAFEITSSWVFFWPLFRILRSVQGVTNVRRQWFNEDRVVFNYMGHGAVINEPFGDSSRYWVGFQDPVLSVSIDIGPLHEAFKAYTGRTFVYATQGVSNGT